MTRNRLANIALAYARVSTVEQAEGMSVDAQLRTIRSHAVQRQLSILREFADRGATGTDDQRTEFLRMIEEVLSPSCTASTILVVHTSRFMRDVELARRYKRELRRHGVRVVAIQQQTADDPNGELMEGVYELFDQHESRIIGMRTRAAMSENARQGFVNGAAAPFGFRVEVASGQGRKKGRLAVDDNEAVIVREVFDRYVAGAGAKDIARALSEGRPSHRGKRWSRELVLRTLAEPAVAGDYRWGKVETRTGRLRPEAEHIKATVPAIISRELFDAAQELRRQRDPVKGDGRHRHTTQLLGGLLRCACGQAYQLETSGKRTPAGDIRRYYQCRAFCRAGKGACRGFRVRTQVLDEAVLEHLVEQFTADRVRDALTAYVAELEQARRALAEDRANLQTEAAELERRIQRWAEAFEAGVAIADLGTERLTQLRAERAEVTRRLGDLGSGAPPPPFLYRRSAALALTRRLRSAFASRDRLAVRGLLERMVERMVIDRGDVVVHYDLGGIVSLLAERGPNPNLEPTAAKVRTDVHRWRAPGDSNH